MKIDIIGQGNVATHLLRAFTDVADVRGVNSHTLAGKRSDADVTLIAVSDSAIAEVATRLAESGDGEKGGVVAHTSGSTPADVLCHFRSFGVFYPLQTFSRDIALDYSEIPFFIEANSAEAEDTLIKLAGKVSVNVHRADSAQRKAMHVAAVLACNFTNHLWALSDRLLHKSGMDFSMLRPLLKETLRKTEQHSPSECQTGPAARGDMEIIREHETMLADMPEIQQIYQLLSQSIIEVKSEK